MPKEARSKSIAFKVVAKMNALFKTEEKAHKDKAFGQGLIDLRHREELPIINQIHDLVFDCAPKQGSALEGAVNYTKKIWGDLLPYLDEPYLELSNNLAERCVKPFVVNKLIERGYVQNIKSAKKKIERSDPKVWDIVEDVINQENTNVE